MSAEPLYLSVMSKIKKDILSGVYSTGDKLPTEAELCQDYAVSRVTVRQAIRLLEEKGYVKRRQGSGTYVTYYRAYSAVKHSAQITPFSEEMALAGKAFSARVITLNLIKASPELARELNLRAGEDVSFTERVMMGDEKPITLEQGYLPVRTFPDVSFSVLQSSMTHYIEQQRGIHINCAHIVADAIMPDERLCSLLKVGADVPLLRLTQLVFDDDGLPIEKTILTFDTRIYEPSFIKTR